MSNWAIAFIIVCVIFAPLIILTGVVGAAASIAPGTRDSVSIFGVFLAILVLAAPIALTGYMAAKVT